MTLEIKLRSLKWTLFLGALLFAVLMKPGTALAGGGMLNRFMPDPQEISKADEARLRRLGQVMDERLQMSSITSYGRSTPGLLMFPTVADAWGVAGKGDAVTDLENIVAKNADHPDRMLTQVVEYLDNWVDKKPAPMSEETMRKYRGMNPNFTLEGAHVANRSIQSGKVAMIRLQYGSQMRGLPDPGGRWEDVAKVNYPELSNRHLTRPTFTTATAPRSPSPIKPIAAPRQPPRTRVGVLDRVRAVIGRRP